MCAKARECANSEIVEAFGAGKSDCGYPFAKAQRSGGTVANWLWQIQNQMAQTIDDAHTGNSVRHDVKPATSLCATVGRSDFSLELMVITTD